VVLVVALDRAALQPSRAPQTHADLGVLAQADEFSVRRPIPTNDYVSLSASTNLITTVSSPGRSEWLT
jgi:hypothetical protein